MRKRRTNGLWMYFHMEEQQKDKTTTLRTHYSTDTCKHWQTIKN